MPAWGPPHPHPSPYTKLGLGLCKPLWFPNGGRILFQGVNLHQSADWRRRCQHRMGSVYQNHALILQQTARQNVLKAFVSTLASFLPPEPRLQEQALAMLNLVGLQEQAEQRVHLLSGG